MRIISREFHDVEIEDVRLITMDCLLGLRAMERCCASHRLEDVTRLKVGRVRL
jgi:hypothetical protein